MSFKKSLVAITKGNLSGAVDKIPDDLLTADVDELEKEICPTKKQKELKLSIQEELNLANLEDRKVVLSNFCRGVISEAYFRKHIATNRELMAWMLIPTTNSELKLKRIYTDAVTHVDNIMDDIMFELKHADKASDKRILRDQFYKFFYTIASRVAPIVQRQEIKTQVIPAEAAPQGQSTIVKVESVEDKIKRLEAERDGSK